MEYDDYSLWAHTATHSSIIVLSAHLTAASTNRLAKAPLRAVCGFEPSTFPLSTRPHHYRAMSHWDLSGVVFSSFSTLSAKQRANDLPLNVVRGVICPSVYTFSGPSLARHRLKMFLVGNRITSGRRRSLRPDYCDTDSRVVKREP